ncbi:WUSCHEL-related homeobox like [Quillaja saponaria]|uniref:WUSCHEL-related homeobox like n=1 Tax=Quillaja saponaria TaxID=32244 RepID=A0AAD7PVS5_QUISA|nr:WUSCHEL-related homeobox like [Quillaja saponaria]
MASSNRHWPSMFKSKPCNTHHHQLQHDINSSLMSTGCHRSPYTSGCEERSPEPKPRWNPKPEQIRILEAIFNSGMVNPPREEIRKIRAQLQEYGQVGDANVFYWFQNRKSRSKHKLRHLQNSKNQNQTSNTSAPISSFTTTTIAPSSSSSSSEKSSPKSVPNNKTLISMGFTNLNDVVSNSPTGSVNQTYFQNHNENSLPAEPFFFPMQTTGGMTQGFCFSELSNVVQVPHDEQNVGVGPCTSLLLSELMNQNTSSKKDVIHDDDERVFMKMHPQQLGFSVSSTTPTIATTTSTVPSHINQLQGVSEQASVGPTGLAKSTVFINDVAFEVAVGPFNVRGAFGDDAVLIHSSGQPVLTNEWGVTIQSLQHGAFYYLI